ncbi:hypothetical protein [Mycoplasma todarodis]|uniref:Uncharacterized protein n=1 Tax=Mycoplasma todarodis TaxID=1937191 RepID=A0A4R0XMT9_9MOLU|nr:hypothetical protein [Mycoplasma todarodis]TCG10782.1 hypothetical protein C4B25_03095 [Mycoplasma todarodis]
MRVRLTYKNKVVKWPALNTNVVFIGDELIDKALIAKTLEQGIYSVEEFLQLAIRKEITEKEFDNKLTQTNLVLFIKRVFNEFNKTLEELFRGEAKFKITSCGIDSLAMAREIRQIINEGDFAKDITIDEIPADIFFKRAITYIYYGSRIAEDKEYVNKFTEQIIMRELIESKDDTEELIKTMNNSQNNFFVTTNSIPFAKEFVSQVKNSEFILIQETSKGIRYIRNIKQFNEFCKRSEK